MNWRIWCFVGMTITISLVVCYRQALANDVSYNYDDLGRLTTITYNDGSKLTITGSIIDTSGNITQKNISSSIIDTDGDGMPDGWETAHGLNPNDPADALLDPDGDGLNNLAEYRAGTDPHNPDTDGDGVSDGAEVAAGTNPLDPASHPAVSDGDVPLMSDLAMGLLALLLMVLGMRNLPQHPNRNHFPFMLFFLPLLHQAANVEASKILSHLLRPFLLVAFLLISLPPLPCFADCSCTIGPNGINVIGFELIATQCPVTPFSDSHVYTYLMNPINCNGQAIYNYSTYGDTQASPSSLINYYISMGYRVLRNNSGTHLIAVQKGSYSFTGFVSGVNMASAAPGVYYTTPASSMDQYCTEHPVPDQNQDGVPDCLEQPKFVPSQNFGPPLCPVE